MRARLKTYGKQSTSLLARAIRDCNAKARRLEVMQPAGLIKTVLKERDHLFEVSQS